MNRVLAVLGALGAGALMMYLFDPNGGTRRRAMIRDKAVGLTNDVTDAVGKQKRHLANKARGIAHNARAMVDETTNMLTSAKDASTARPAGRQT